MKLIVADQQGKIIDQQQIKLTVSSKVDLKKVIVAQLSAQHQKTVAAKSRGQVAGSNKKPWRQKGTGRARAGSSQSPLWIGGGIIFAPKANHQSKLKINQKEKKLARLILLQEKIKDKNVVLLNKITMEKAQTKIIANLLDKLGFESKKVLLITQKQSQPLKLSCQNIKKLNYKTTQQISSLDLAKHQKIIITKAAMEKLL